MKKTISLLLAIIMILPTFAFAAEVDKDNTVIYLDFENLVPEGVATEGELSYEKGIEGNEAVFDGATYLELPENITKDVEDFTVSCWVRFDSITPNVWQRVFDFGNEEGSSLFLGTWQWQGSNNVRGGVRGSQVTTFGAYDLGEWVHYAIVQEGDGVTLYLNGREVASATNEIRLKDAECVNNYIGFYNKNTEPTEMFRGALDEFIFADYAMSAESINEMAFIGLDDEKKVESLEARVYLTKNEDGTFDYFTFDDGVSSVTWKSSMSDVITVEEGIKNADGELKDVKLTAVITSGDAVKEIEYDYVVGEIDGVVTAKETTLEKIEIDRIRKTSIEIDTNKAYYIKSGGKFLSEIDGALTLVDKSSEDALWRFAAAPKTNNTYAIFNIKSGKCFDVRDFGTEKGTEVIMYSGGKGMNQIWYVVESEGKYGILGYQSEWFLNDDFILHGLDDYTKWEIVETENTLVQTGKVMLPEDDKYLELEDNAYYALRCEAGYLATEGDRLVIARNSYAHNAQWLVTHIDESYYTLVNRVTGKNLNISGGNTGAGASVILWAGAAGGNEQFNFEKTDKGVLISSKDNKNYLCYNKALTMNEEESYWTVVKTGKAKARVEAEGDTYLTEYIPPVREEVSEEGFVHPGILITKDDIVRMQTKVREGAQIWADSFEKLASDGFSNRNVRIYAYDSNADTTALKTEARLKNMRMDARAVSNQALMYVITGDEKYRENAMTILRMWSELRDVYTTLGSDRIDHGEIAFKMAFAAELMKYTDCENARLAWTDEDNEKFVGMLETIRPKHDSWWYWMNQHGICNLGTMANAIFRNDAELYKAAVVRTTTNPQGGGGIDYTRGSGGSITQIFRIVDFDALNGDTIEPTLVHSEMGRDQGHAYGCLGALSLCARMAHTQNTKVDRVTGEYSTKDDAVNIFEFADERLLQAASYIGKYNLGYDVMHPTIDVGEFYTDINDTNRGNIYVTFGILYNYYKYEKGVDMDDEKYRYLKEAHEYVYPEGGINDFYIGYSDLLFTPEDAVVDMADYVRDGESGTTWQIENYTAVNSGSAEKCDGYAKAELTQNGTQLAVTNGNYPPGVRGHVILRVKTTDAVKVVLQNEHTVYAPFVTGIIPDTDGEWQEIIFEVESEGVMRQRIFFLTFFGEGEIEVDYMKFTE